MSTPTRRVYFDTADLHRIERLRSQSDSEFARLVARLGELRILPALSLHHFIETSQLDDEGSAHRRLDCVAAFGTVVVDLAGSHMVIEREAAFALGVEPQPTADDAASALWDMMFEQVDGEAVRSGVRGLLPTLRQFRPAFEQAAIAKQTTRGLRRSRNLRSVAADESARLLDEAELRRELKRQGVPAQMTGPMLEMCRNLRARLTPGGKARDAYVRFLGLEQFEFARSLADNELPWAKAFVDAATRLAPDMERIGLIPPGSASGRLARIDPRKCPGFRIGLAIDTESDRSTLRAKGADESDRDHAMYAPYVDVLFADKRTIHLLTTAASRKGASLQPSDFASVRRSVAARSGASLADRLCNEIETALAAKGRGP